MPVTKRASCDTHRARRPPAAGRLRLVAVGAARLEFVGPAGRPASRPRHRRFPPGPLAAPEPESQLAPEAAAIGDSGPSPVEIGSSTPMPPYDQGRLASKKILQLISRRP